jgi:hypothetical protein
MHKESANLKEQFGALRTIAGPYVSHTILAETKVAGMFGHHGTIDGEL